MLSLVIVQTISMVVALLIARSIKLLHHVAYYTKSNVQLKCVMPNSLTIWVDSGQSLTKEHQH